MNTYLFNTAAYLGITIATGPLHQAVMTPHFRHKMGTYSIIFIMNKYLFNAAAYLGITIATSQLHQAVMTPHFRHKMRTYSVMINLTATDCDRQIFWSLGVGSGYKTYSYKFFDFELW